jgi:hypothetical protein
MLTEILYVAPEAGNGIRCTVAQTCWCEDVEATLADRFWTVFLLNRMYGTWEIFDQSDPPGFKLPSISKLSIINSWRFAGTTPSSDTGFANLIP